MRPLLAAQLCLTVFQAFLLAPVQHVHEGEEAEGHGHSTLVHAHFAAHHAQALAPGLRGIDDADEHEAWSLDTFTIVPPVGFAPFLLARAPDMLLPLETEMGVVGQVEECAHDPPCHRLSVPRAPPV
ncbi:MAG TPA: hypothetical protein VKT49_18635 [Bryobacteraceae bacterium]|nr:hypothetical protein [Bryobacteraceae bacterium]